MYSDVLKSINIKHTADDMGVEEKKSDERRVYTAMDFVNKHRDFSKITKADLELVFIKLQKLCPETWTREYENRVRELNEKFMLLKGGNAWKYIDADLDDEYKDNDSEVLQLMASPEVWSMNTTERAEEFSEILRHFTLFATFEGRPFIRAWLTALLPCFTRWIILSDQKDELLTNTLKKFLGSFGQPGIVVCLPDKGASMLKTLKHAAKSVEAVGRGNVEKHYWKRVAGSARDQENAWKNLVNIENNPLERSQLDYVEKDWIMDSTDWGHVFANIISPEISELFEMKIKEALGTKGRYAIHGGPPKTLARSLAKGNEYMNEFLAEPHLPRWKQFAERFQTLFGRLPSKPEDFVWNIVDAARCSITVPTARDVLEVKRIIEEKFKVICQKNGYRCDFNVRGSGYRDFKLLVEIEFDGLKLEGVPKVQPKTMFICELQVLCEAWLDNKKTTSASYKILRAGTLQYLLHDLSKYAKKKSHETSFIQIDAKEVVRNAWVNLAKGTDFSKIDANELLLTAASQNWAPASVKMLLIDLKADIEVRDAENATALIVAGKWGNDDLVTLLLELGCNINAKDKYNETAISWASAYERPGCVRILRAARGSNKSGRAALNNARTNSKQKGDGKSQRTLSITFEVLEKAALEGHLARMFDSHDIRQTLVTELLPTQAAVTSVENTLQCLWFGADVHVELGGEIPIGLAGHYGNPASVNALLENGAKINAGDSKSGVTALINAAFYWQNDVLNFLVDARCDVNVQRRSGGTALQHASQVGNLAAIKKLLGAKATVSSDSVDLATHSRNSDVPEILRLLKRAHDTQMGRSYMK